MGRPERAVDPTAGPVQLLAHRLRELRGAVGNPSYRAMAEDAGFSATTLSQAAAGERLPSLAVVLGYVKACGGDPGEWEPYWKEAEAAAAAVPVGDEKDAPPPYRGLARFEPDDHELFFGRDRMVAEVCELVTAHRFAAVFGASGSGKSSLLRAGVVPRMRASIARQECAVALRVFTPGARPAETYGHLLTPAANEPESWVVVDQFEEVFTLCRDEAERARFIDLLLTAREPGSRLRVLIAVRADFYARCGEHAELASALSRAGLLVGPMNADELREAVVKPALAAGALVERSLATTIVDEVLDCPGALPMLSHALLETWRRRKGRMLTTAAYEAAGGLSGAIAATAEEVYGQLSAPQAAVARLLLLRLVEPGRGTVDTGRPFTRADLKRCAHPDTPVVVERLARARLLTVDEDSVRLAHEALITCWPRLHGWIEQDRERLRHHRQLTEATRAWLEHGRDPGTLYRGTRLARAEEMFPDHDGDPALAPVERSFLTAAFEAREAENRAAARSPGEPVDSLAFSPDNATLYAGGGHVPLHRHTVDPTRAIAQVCARAGNEDLTRSEWTRTYRTRRTEGCATEGQRSAVVVRRSRTIFVVVTGPAFGDTDADFFLSGLMAYLKEKSTVALPGLPPTCTAKTQVPERL